MNKNITGAEYLLNQISICKKELKISCNDGAICINALTMDFTYISKFGALISNSIIKNNAVQDICKKLIIVHIYMDLYATRNGGFNIITN
jgi:hypothetical protein